MLRALQSEFESHISAEEHNLDEKFHGDLLSTYVDCIEMELLTERDHIRNRSSELATILKPQTRQIVQKIQFYKEMKLKRAKESVCLKIENQAETRHPRANIKPSSSNDNMVKLALKEKLEEYCRDDYLTFDEQYASDEEDDEAKLSGMKKLRRQNLALAGQIALLQNILIQRKG